MHVSSACGAQGGSKHGANITANDKDNNGANNINMNTMDSMAESPASSWPGIGPPSSRRPPVRMLNQH